ncbi:MAG: 50S ribosome-binding GTPase [Rickettsiales bacterium]|nr:50S ribosome-binding GTPase [Rickettsiales bacterium]
MGQFKERTIICIVGSMNAGKSTLYNLITGQKNSSIVDEKEGTTADNVMNFMEIHGLGKCKIIDTAGIDEYGILGDKKREKVKDAIGESNIILFVIKNTATNLTDYEKRMIEFIKRKKKQILVIVNKFNNKETILKVDAPVLNIDINSEKQLTITDFIKKNYTFDNKPIELLPNLNYKNKYVLLVIPLDEESPELRLLRPQSLMIERLLQKFAVPVLYRPNLKNFDVDEFKTAIDNLQYTKNGLIQIITDSQVIDKIYDYIPKNINFTSFSMLMSNYMSNGKLDTFVRNTSILNKLQNEDKILIVECCKHDRKCNDIATVQIPNAIKKYTNKNLIIEFNFGVSFLTEKELKKKKYKLAILCGGCMIDRQKYLDRLEIFEKNDIPVTNYGTIFSHIKKSQKNNS